MQQFQELSVQFEHYLKEHSFFPALPENLYQPCRSVVASGGKHVRPALCLMSGELFGKLSEDVFHAAAALELFHNFTLIHDDIMDHAPLRRGKPTIHSEYGVATGILAGDVMNIYAYEQLSKINTACLPKILKIFNKTAIEVCEGQQLDMDYEAEDDINLDKYLEMISLKTSVLLAASAQIGAVLGGADEEDALNCYRFGKNLGIAFQLQDDYLDAFGAKKQTGKLLGGDIISNKKTLLYVGFKELTDDKQNDLYNHYATLAPEEKVSKTIMLYKDLKIDEYAKKLIASYSDQALAYLNKIKKPAEQLSALRELAVALLNRTC